MKKFILITPFLCVLVSIFLSACASEPAVQSTTTTTRETTVAQPAATQTTTTHSTGY